ncbi:MAG: methyltransferase domain-containing protein [Acidimicrobiales bacterium]
MEHHDLVRRQFGANAANYATSPVHAKGASLQRLVDVLEPAADWRALDIATAAGHTAFALAPHVREVVATDLTPEMLDVGRAGAQERDIHNVTFEPADAEALPFDDASFDLVTCRIAPHHFPNPDRFVTESARVLRPGGRLGLVDNVVPDDPIAADFANDWERRRDPSHLLCLSLDRWLDLLTAAGLQVLHSELLAKRMVFSTWAENMNVTAHVRASLLADLRNAPPEALEFLRPELAEDGDEATAAFHLTECVVAAAKKPE